jgi:hypothetical protein
MITVLDFCRIYDISYENMMTQRCVGKYPKHWFLKNEKGLLLIDDKKIIDRYKFKKKIENLSQKNYYFLSKHFTDWSMSDLISTYDGFLTQTSVNMFLNKSLFAFDDRSIVSYTITKLQWKFYKISTSIIQHMFRVKNIKRSDRILEKIWDNKPPTNFPNSKKLYVDINFKKSP